MFNTILLCIHFYFNLFTLLRGDDTTGDALLRSEWNKHVMRDVISPLYALLLIKACQFLQSQTASALSASVHTVILSRFLMLDCSTRTCVSSDLCILQIVSCHNTLAIFMHVITKPLLHSLSFSIFSFFFFSSFFFSFFFSFSFFFFYLLQVPLLTSPLYHFKQE